MTSMSTPPTPPRARPVAGSWALFLVLGALALLPGGCGREGGGTGGGPSVPAPDFDLEKVGGGRLKLAELRGQLVLLDFWATWCVPCVKSIPELNTLYRRHREEGFTVVGLAVEDLEAEPLAAWLEERSVDYPVARTDTELAGRYAAYEFPKHVLISREGRVLESFEPGFHSLDELEAKIAPHLARTGG